MQQPREASRDPTTARLSATARLRFEGRVCCTHTMYKTPPTAHPEQLINVVLRCLQGGVVICSQKLGACRLRVGRDPIDKLTTAGGATNRYPGNFYRFGRFARLGSCLLRCLAALAPLALLASLGACPVWPRKGDDRGQQWQAEPRAGPSRARTGTFLHGLIIARRGQRAAHTSAPTLTRPQVGLWVRSYAAVAWAALFTSRSPTTN